MHFAVDTEQGLLSPVIHNAGDLSLAGLALMTNTQLLLPIIGNELGLSFSQIGLIMTCQYVAGAVASPAYALFAMNRELAKLDGRDFGGTRTHAKPWNHGPSCDK